MVSRWDAGDSSWQSLLAGLGGGEDGKQTGRGSLNMDSIRKSNGPEDPGGAWIRRGASGTCHLVKRHPMQVPPTVLKGWLSFHI